MNTLKLCVFVSLVISGATLSRGANPPFTDADWVSLGTVNGANGLDYVAYSITYDNSGNLYAGGMFLHAGGINVSNVAKWNGSSWTPLGSGMSSTYPPSAVF